MELPTISGKTCDRSREEAIKREAASAKLSASVYRSCLVFRSPLLATLAITRKLSSKIKSNPENIIHQQKVFHQSRPLFVKTRRRPEFQDRPIHRNSQVVAGLALLSCCRLILSFNRFEFRIVLQSYVSRLRILENLS